MLPQKLDLAKMQTIWAQALNPVIANLLLQGQLLSNQELITGTNAVNHKLGRNPVGWFLVSPQGPSVVYQEAYQPNPTLFLTLNSSADMTTGIWVF